MVLLNAVLSALPTYYFSMMKAPSSITQKLIQLQRNFLWGGRVGDERRRIPWVAWDLVCRAKEDGGLGVKNLKAFNSALLSKWAWRLLTGGNALWVQVVKSRYGDFWDNMEWFVANKHKGHWSSWWKDLLRETSQSDWFSTHCVKRMGNGRNTRFWEDSWVSDGVKLKLKFPRLYRLDSVKEDRKSVV